MHPRQLRSTRGTSKRGSHLLGLTVSVRHDPFVRTHPGKPSQQGLNVGLGDSCQALHGNARNHGRQLRTRVRECVERPHP